MTVDGNHMAALNNNKPPYENGGTPTRSYRNLPDPDIKYSISVPPDLHESQPEYFTTFRPRRHRDAHLADEACRQHYVDWVENIGPTGMVGCLCEYTGALAGISGCECLPERLGTVSYVIEYGFFYDGIIADLDFGEVTHCLIRL